MGCQPYQITTGCCDDWDTYSPELQDRAESLAWAAIRFLTAGLVGQCPIVTRPCVEDRCRACRHGTLNGPYVWRGEWYNAVSCPHTGCSCDPLPEVRLPGQVAQVVSVLVDGAPLVEGVEYRMLSGNRLVRVDGGVWPSCQDFTAPYDGPGAFSVEYVPGVAPDTAGLWAVGVLACEFAKACSGGKCRLPASVQTLSRQGVSMSFDNSLFANGQTGIREVDAYVLSVNPYRMKQPSLVWSPDTLRTTYTGKL